MSSVNTFGKVKSATIFDDSKKGEIILRTNSGDVTLKIANDHESAFNGMCAIISAGIEFGTGPPAQAPNVHVKYDDSDMEIDELTLHYH
jgi:hypothetical protein